MSNFRFRRSLRILLPLLLACGAALSVVSCDGKPPPQPVAPTAPPAPNPRIIYELREKCGKDAREWFSHNYGDGTQTLADKIMINGKYSNHYSEKLNRCYALVIQEGTVLDKKDIVYTLDRYLFEVSENKELGRFFINSKLKKPIHCYLADLKCDSQEEWNGLASSYMEQ